MKVSGIISGMPTHVGRLLIAVSLSMAFTLATNVAPAQAITRAEVLKRANSWIAKRILYSQSGHYQGYRRDCSGFVSMAWKLKTSYTSSTIVGQARRISVNSLKPGDAVRRPGHVEIFAGWKNRRKRQYWALEEVGSGKPAMRRVKRFKKGYTALRRRGIEEPRTVVLPKPAPKPLPVVPPSTDTSSTAGTSTVDP